MKDRAIFDDAMKCSNALKVILSQRKAYLSVGESSSSQYMQELNEYRNLQEASLIIRHTISCYLLGHGFTPEDVLFIRGLQRSLGIIDHAQQEELVVNSFVADALSSVVNAFSAVINFFSAFRLCTGLSSAAVLPLEEFHSRDLRGERSALENRNQCILDGDDDASVRTTFRSHATSFPINGSLDRALSAIPEMELEVGPRMNGGLVLEDVSDF